MLTRDGMSNGTPLSHIIAVDTTLAGAEPSFPQNPPVFHLHGGFVPWISDGGPFAWFDPTGATGPSFMNNQVLNPGAPLESSEHFYPNSQSARFMWYHDHA